MSLSTKELEEIIGKAVAAFRNELLPKSASVCPDDQDQNRLQEKLAALERLHRESKDPPVFALRFLGDTQNGKSTLINVLLGRKVLPEGSVGACSATIVRCRYKSQSEITIRFRYFSKEKFDEDLNEAIMEAENALTVEEESPGKQREIVCESLSRFLRLFKIEKESVADNAKLISLCREWGQSFEERDLLGTEEQLTVSAKNEEQIRENLSARSRRAFIVDECVVEGAFSEWHPQMELVDMPGTNASDPWDEEVKERLKQRISSLVIVTKETQILGTVLDWFKDTSILQEVVGSSERNQTRVFVIKNICRPIEPSRRGRFPKKRMGGNKKALPRDRVSFSQTNAGSRWSAVFGEK